MIVLLWMVTAFLFILQAFWFVLPGFAANSAPVLGKKILKQLDIPVDAGRSWKGKRIFGDHKTVRGFLLGTISGIVVAGGQAALLAFPVMREFTLMPYEDVNWLAIGFLMGFGALVGDSVKSFFKRRINIAPGKSWFPFDQLDALVGAYLFLLPVYVVPGETMLFLLLFVPALHLLSNVVAYRMKWKETWT